MINSIAVCNLLLFALLVFKNSAYGEKKMPSVCPNILTYRDWNGRTPLRAYYTTIPQTYVVIHHTATDSCENRNNCSNIVREIQKFHMEYMGFYNIGYNFLIGSDGYVYEGAGFHKVGAHTKGFNSRSIGLALIGNFMKQEPTEIQLETTKSFLDCAVQLGELERNFTLIGAGQVSPTPSPGNKLFQIIKTWPNFLQNQK